MAKGHVGDHGGWCVKTAQFKRWDDRCNAYYGKIRCSLPLELHTDHAHKFQDKNGTVIQTSAPIVFMSNDDVKAFPPKDVQTGPAPPLPSAGKAVPPSPMWHPGMGPLSPSFTDMPVASTSRERLAELVTNGTVPEELLQPITDVLQDYRRDLERLYAENQAQGAKLQRHFTGTQILDNVREEINKIISGESPQRNFGEEFSETVVALPIELVGKLYVALDLMKGK